jgi:TorA maturation chaperone TorD
MGKCDTIELLRLEGRYQKFIVENHTELNLLEHVEKCEDCKEEILRAVEKDELLADYGNLFQKEVADPIVPQSSDYKNPANFIDTRIQWRKRRLNELMENAEMELKSLRARLADS